MQASYPPPRTRMEAAPLVEKTKQVMRWLKDDGKPLNQKNLLNVINRHCKVSNTDVDVLASALYEVSQGYKIVVAEKDRDFEEAIDMIKKDHAEYKTKLFYVNPKR